jgi:hypothetical protein
MASLDRAAGWAALAAFVAAPSACDFSSTRGAYDASFAYDGPEGRDAASGPDASGDDAPHDAQPGDATLAREDGGEGGGGEGGGADAGGADGAADGASAESGADAAPGGFALFRISPSAAGGSPNGDSYLAEPTASGPVVSADGRYVAFSSLATDLLPTPAPDAGGSVVRYFVRDLDAGTTEQVSLLPDGGDLYDPYGGGSFVLAISGDGRYVVFNVPAGLWDPAAYPDYQHGSTTQTFVLRDRSQRTSTLVGIESNGTLYAGSQALLSGDGRFLVFTGSNGLEPLRGDVGSPSGSEVWLRDLTQDGGALTVVSVTDGPLDGGPDASSALPANSGVIAGNNVGNPSMTRDGTKVAFDTVSQSLLLAADAGAPYSENRHCFLRDLTAQSTRLIDVALAGTGDAGPWPDGECDGPVLSGTGRFVVFASASDNLVAGDTNGQPDLFVRDLANLTTERVNIAEDGSQVSPTTSVLPESYAISDDGSYVVFWSGQGQYYALDAATTTSAVFVRDRVNHRTLRVSFASDGSELMSPEQVWLPTLSADGSLVVFGASGPGLFPDKTDYHREVVGVRRAAAR